jgi:hypothetical protein
MYIFLHLLNNYNEVFGFDDIIGLLQYINFGI